MYNKELEGERCDFCDNGILRFKLCREIIRQGENLAIIENVPTFVCTYCGMHYHLANVTKKMGHLIKNKEKLNHQISVPVAEYDMIL